MAVTIKGAVKEDLWEGLADGTQKIITPPAGLVTGDLIVIFFGTVIGTYLSDDKYSRLKVTCPDFEEAHSPNTFSQLAPSIHAFYRFYDATDVSYTFTLKNLFGDGTEDTTANALTGREGAFAQWALGNVCSRASIEYVRGEPVDARIGHTKTWTIPTSKDDCLLLQCLLGSRWNSTCTTNTNAHVSTLDADFTQGQGQSFTEKPRRTIANSAFIPTDSTCEIATLMRSGSWQTTGQGNFPVDFTAGSVFNVADGLKQGYHVVLAISDKDAPGCPDLVINDPDGVPSQAAVGVFTKEVDITSALDYEIWRANSGGTLVKDPNTNISAKCFGVKFFFNALGCCIKGEAYFDQNPITKPYDYVIRFLLDTPAFTQPEYWYSALTINSKKVNNTWVLEVKDLLELVIDARVGNNPDMHQLDNIFVNQINIFSGQDIPIVNDSEESYQSWRDYLLQKYEPWEEEAAYGVTAALEYLQGRQRDGIPLEIPYQGDYNVEIDPATLNDYRSEWWAKPSVGAILSEQRTDLDYLVPRRVVQASVNVADFLLQPVSSIITPNQEASHIITLRGIAKPPFKFTGLPDTGVQYAASSEVNIEPSTTGQGNSITSTIRTSALLGFRNTE